VGAVGEVGEVYSRRHGRRCHSGTTSHSSYKVVGSGVLGGGDDIGVGGRRRRRQHYLAAATCLGAGGEVAAAATARCTAAARWSPPRLGWAARSDFDHVPSAPGHLARLRCTKRTLLQNRTEIGRLPTCFVRAPAARKIRVPPSSEGM
jgi:hypothetical protein